MVVMSILGMMGCDLGMASCTLTKSTFGDKGGRYIVSLIFAINLIGWFGIQNGVCGEAFTNFMSEYAGIEVPLVVSNILWGIIMLLTAVFGMSALEKLDYVSIPFLIVVMALGTYLAIKEYGMSGMGKEVTQTMSFLGGVGLSFNFLCGRHHHRGRYYQVSEVEKRYDQICRLGCFPDGGYHLGPGRTADQDC